MSSSAPEHLGISALRVKVTRDALTVDLSDGRTIIAPLVWFPRLIHATPKERNSWRLIGRGVGIHWDAVDEDISVANLLNGHRSGESHESLRKWLATRPKPRRGGRS
jgi:hypothetical protein